MLRSQIVRTAAHTAYRVVGIFVVILFCSSPVAAQPVVGSVQPDVLSLGTIRVGATVEASVRIFGAGDNTAGVVVKTQPPRFVRVTETRLGTQKFGELGTFVVCDVVIALDTTSAGEFSDKLRVQVGEVEVDVPVVASVLAQEDKLSRVLVVETPFNRFSTSDASIFDTWLDLVKSAKLDVSYLEVDRGQPVLRDLDLSGFDVVLLAGTGLHFARDGDFEKLRKFVGSGGRVIIAANHFMSGSVAKANEFVIPFGLKMTDTELQNGVTLVSDEADITKHELTAGVDQLKFHRPSPVAVEDEKVGKILVGITGYPDLGVVAVANADRGQVVVLGVSLWWHWIVSEPESEVDNARLLKNLLRKP